MLLVSVAALLAAPAQPAFASHNLPPEAAWSETYIESFDGTRLHLDIVRPKGLPSDAKTPVILQATPYTGANDETPPTSVALPDHDAPNLNLPAPWVPALLQRGYTLVVLTLRGFGASGGCTDWMGASEQSDIEAGIKWAAAQDWSTGRVGAIGSSYSGAAAVAALGRRVSQLAAAVILNPASDPYRKSFTNGVRSFEFPAEREFAYYNSQAVYPAPPSAQRQPDTAAEQQTQAAQSGIAGVLCAPRLLAEAGNPDPSSAFWRERNLIPEALGTSVPTLWSHGFVDFNVSPAQVHEIYGSQTGPKRIWFGQYAHNPPTDNTAGRGGTFSVDFFDEALRWYDRYVKGLPEEAAPVGNDPPAVIQEGYEGKWRREEQWPPADMSYSELELEKGSYRDSAGNKAEPGFRPEDTRCQQVETRCGPGVPQGTGAWTFSEPYSRPTHLAGVPHLSAKISQRARQVNVIALLYDIDPAGNAAFITRGAALSKDASASPISAGATRKVKFDLYPQDWAIEPGHRLGLLLTGADDYQWHPGTSGTTVEVRGGGIELPLLSRPRTPSLDGGPSPWVRNRPTFKVDATP